MDWRWTYCWWNKSRTTWYGKCPMIYRVSHVSIGAGFLPSTVWHGASSRPRRSVGWTKVFVVSNNVPSGCLLKHPPAGASCGISCQQISVCNRWVSGECIIPTGKKTRLKSNHAHFAAIFLYLSRKLLPFIIFTKDLILYAWMLSLLLALLPPKTNKKKEGQNIYRPAKAFQICKATDVVSKVQNRRQP